MRLPLSVQRAKLRSEKRVDSRSICEDVTEEFRLSAGSRFFVDFVDISPTAGEAG